MPRRSIDAKASASTSTRQLFRSSSLYIYIRRHLKDTNGKKVLYKESAVPSNRFICFPVSLIFFSVLSNF